MINRTTNATTQVTTSPYASEENCPWYIPWALLMRSNNSSEIRRNHQSNSVNLKVTAFVSAALALAAASTKYSGTRSKKTATTILRDCSDANQEDPIAKAIAASTATSATEKTIRTKGFCEITTFGCARCNIVVFYRSALRDNLKI